MVHRAILGSCERLLAILTEHYVGKWPFWLSPRQAIVCTVSDSFNEYAEKVYHKLRYEGYQVNLDKGGQTVPKKVAKAVTDQYNYIIVVGKEEVANSTVAVRLREAKEGEKPVTYTIPALIELFKSLEPAKSKAELALLEQIFKEESHFDKTEKESDLNTLEEKLKFNLFLTGDELSEEDKKQYELFKSQEINKEFYPNLFKWKKLVGKSLD